jgi:hypothetical protein
MNNVPQDDRKACLCRDGSYSKKCCGGDYFNQGIGQSQASTPSILTLQGILNAVVNPHIVYMTATVNARNEAFNIRFEAHLENTYRTEQYNDVTPVNNGSITVNFNSTEAVFYIRARVEGDSYTGEWVESTINVI